MESESSQAKSPETRVAVFCPNCRQGYKIAARLIGRRLTCKKCRHEWRADEAAPEDIRNARLGRSEPPSDSGQVGLDADLPPTAGSSSISIDMSWAGRHIGRYRARSLLGHGGMGVVWRAHDSTLRRDVALKILNRRRENGPNGGLNLDLFMQEARAVARLQHPSVVSIFEVNEDQGHVFLALELMEGGTLKECVDSNGPIPPRKLFGWMIGPAKALAIAHERGIIHRDVKPGNLMFDDHGHLKLMDFGLADVSQEQVSEKLRGKAVGSLGWVAPETARGEQTTPLSDLYSFGLVLLFALTGKPHIHAKSRSEILRLHRHPPSLELDGISGLTHKGRELLHKCVAADPAERFQSAGQLVAALQSCADENPAAQREQRKSRIAIAMTAATIAALLGASGAIYWVLDLQDREDRLSQPIVASPRTKSAAQPVTPTPPDAAPIAAPDNPTVPKAPEGITSESPARPTIPDVRIPWPQVVDAKHLKFIASGRGQVFHRPDGECGAQKIYASNLLNFESFQQAQESGRTPCPACRPEPNGASLAQAPEPENAD